MKRPWSLALFALALAVFTLSLSPRSARAADDEPAKLAALGKALRYTLKTTAPASSIDTGGAAILVRAPLPAVRKIITSYNSYKTFLRPFDQSRVLSKRKGTSEVYLQVPILNGAAHIWTVADMSPPTKEGDDEVIVGRYKRGNVADFRAKWRLRAVDGGNTILKLELLVDPKLPFPPSVVTAQLVRAAEKGVTAVRDRAQAATPAGTRAAAPPPTAAHATAGKPALAPAGAAAAQASETNTAAPPTSTPVPALPSASEDEARRQKDVARR